MRWLALLLCCATLQAGAQFASQYASQDVTQARMYRNGAGVAVDKVRAARLFELAARAGNADAAFTLSNMLRDGEGIPQDPVAARHWLQVAADGESPEALQQLGMEETDPARAAQLFKEAAHALTHTSR